MHAIPYNGCKKMVVIDLSRCTGNDLKMVVRLIKHDLRINAGARQMYVCHVAVLVLTVNFSVLYRGRLGNWKGPLPSSRHHLSYDDCMKDKRGKLCAVLCLLTYEQFLQLTVGF